jgi:hypothetical protein
MDKLQEIEEKYLTNNPWAWNSYLDLVHREDMEWLIQSIKILRDVRISDGAMLIQLENEIAELKKGLHMLKKKRWYAVYRENLELTQELERYKKGIVIKEWTDF